MRRGNSILGVCLPTRIITKLLQDTSKKMRKTNQLLIKWSLKSHQQQVCNWKWNKWLRLTFLCVVETTDDTSASIEDQHKSLYRNNDFKRNQRDNYNSRASKRSSTANNNHKPDYETRNSSNRNSRTNKTENRNSRVKPARNDARNEEPRDVRSTEPRRREPKKGFERYESKGETRWWWKVRNFQTWNFQLVIIEKKQRWKRARFQYTNHSQEVKKQSKNQPTILWWFFM